MFAWIARLLALTLFAMLAACGGGGGGSTGSTTSTGTSGGSTTPTTPATPTVAANLVAVVVDDGPSALGTGASPTRAVDLPYVTVTICVPGTTTCQTIDHIQVDTGSVGLRILRPVLSTALADALPGQTGPSGNPVGECYGYVDGYVFGSVRSADLTIGGEKIAAMPIHLIADTGRYANAPRECTAGGGTAIATIADLAANGILGIGTTPTDCGAACTRAGGFGAAIYYDCPASGCVTVITRASNTTAPFEQLPNPVAAMTVDNNGSVLVLPALPAGGARTATGTLYFGIGTQTNNQLTAADVLTTTTSSDGNGTGVLSATYNGRTLPLSFVDSGSSAYFFTDSTIAKCTTGSASGYYCPTSPLALSPTLTGTNGRTASAAFTLYNAQLQFATGFAAVPGVGADPGSLPGFDVSASSFDFGAPFFFGRAVFTAIEGMTAGGVAGPYIAY